MSTDERGAAAVEFALVAPLLVALLVGIAEFGRAYQAQTALSGAAREAVRSVALGSTAGEARTAARSVAAPLTLTDAQIAVTGCPATNPSGSNATVVITYTLPFLSEVLGSDLTLRGRGVMRCGG